jgi:Calcineurin-like phosphoesterase
MRHNFYKAAVGCLILSIALSIGAPAATERVVAIGDIHGDMDAFVGILQRAQLIDPSRRWSGGRATLVQTGDFLDRGPKPREVMDLLMSLPKEAQRQGGRVVVLMGNHEAMNIFGDLRYVSNEDYASFADDRADTRNRKTDPSRPAGFPERCEAFGPDGKYGKWLRSLPAIARIDDSIFLHGGIVPDLAAQSVEKLNEEIAAEVKAFDTYKQFMIEKKIAQPCSSLEEVTAAAKGALEKAKGKDADALKAFLGYGAWLSINDSGPLWFRGYAQWTDDEGGPQIERLVKGFGVARFVVGHTPQTGGQIVSRFDGKVYLIDTGMLSTYFKGGRASALNIQDGKISFIY